MEQPIQQSQQPQQVQQPVPVQDKRKQKSLFWIITTMYLTMILSGLVIGFVLTFIASFIFSGLQGFAAAFVSLLLMLVAYIIALKVAVDYVAKKTFVKKEDIVKISTWVALLVIILYALVGLFFRGFSVYDLVIIPSAALVFFATKYFLEKKFKNT